MADALESKVVSPKVLGQRSSAENLLKSSQESLLLSTTTVILSQVSSEHTSYGTIFESSTSNARDPS